MLTAVLRNGCSHICAELVPTLKIGLQDLDFDPRPDMREEIPEGREKITYAKAEYKSREGLIKSEWNVLKTALNINSPLPLKQKFLSPPF